MWKRRDMTLGVLAMSAAIGTASVKGQPIRDFVEVRRHATLSLPVGIYFAPREPATRAYVTSQSGQITLVDRSTTPPTATIFAQIQLSAGEGEIGLLGMAFHPNYNLKGDPGERRFFVYYTGRRAGGDRANLVAEFQRLADDSDAPSSKVVRPILIIEEAQSVLYTGGCIQFGPDGMLYVGVGDHNLRERAQDPTSLLGKLIRIDVDGDDFPQDPQRNYRIPANNPNWPPSLSPGRPVRREAWARGLRNPWRFSFDRLTGDLWIGDIGSSWREEVNFDPAPGTPGRNYGWPYREGSVVLGAPPSDVPPTSLTAPVHEFPSVGSGITGGFVYRGTLIPAWRGRYVFAEYGFGRVWTFDPRADGSPAGLTEHTGRLGASTSALISFGEDQFGELYFVTQFAGAMYMFVPQPGLVQPLTDIVSIGGFPPPDLQVTVDDYTSFINAFAAEDWLADVVSVGGERPPDNLVTMDDYIAFLGSFGSE